MNSKLILTQMQIFAGLWTQNDNQDPHCMRGRTGFFICSENCPVLWKKQTQNQDSFTGYGSQICGP
jgi:hypothetical protein